MWVWLFERYRLLQSVHERLDSQTSRPEAERFQLIIFANAALCTVYIGGSYCVRCVLSGFTHHRLSNWYFDLIFIDNPEIEFPLHCFIKNNIIILEELTNTSSKLEMN